MRTAVVLVSPNLATCRALTTASDDHVIRILDTVRLELPTVQSIGEAKARVDGAAAMQTFLRRRNRSREVQNAAALLGIVAERRCGELLNESPPRRGRPPKSLQGETIPNVAISAIEAHRWRKLATIRGDELERMEAECTATGREFTRAYVWRHVRGMLHLGGDERPWAAWASRREQEAIHTALNRLYGWLAPFQSRPQQRKEGDIRSAEDAIAAVTRDADYLSAHDRALLADHARAAVAVLTPLLDIDAA